MSILEKLTEGIVNRDMKKEGQALLNKWSATGLLEGLESEHMKSTMARLLENQAKELLREASGMGRGDVDGFAAVAFPIVRRVFAGLIANELVSVQPMSLPSGLIFFLDFTYGDELGGTDATTTALRDRFGNLMGTGSIYGGDVVGSQVTGGVSLVGDTYKETLGGPKQAVGYAYASPTGSSEVILNADMALKSTGFVLNGSVSEANAKLIKFDPDLLATTDSSLAVIILDIEKEDIHTAIANDLIDYDNMSAFSEGDGSASSFSAIAGTLFGLTISSEEIKIVRRLTEVVTSGMATTKEAVRFIMVTDDNAMIAGGAAALGSRDTVADMFRFPLKDNALSSVSSGGALTSFTLPLELNDKIPEIDIKVDSIAITAQTKKLKAKWSPELGQDLNAYHNMDAEVELTSILSEQIALEIDREILADLVNGATAAVYYWSRSPGLFVNRVTGAELGATSAAPDFTGTVSEWYETLIETINDVSAQIHVKTLRGGANFIVCSPEVANILEFTSGFRANVTADADKGDIGAVKAGALNRKFDVIVDPYFLRNVILVGRRGNSFLESGYVYAPYVPLQTTPTIFGVEDFVPRKGVMTRYAKKMVRPDMYGLVVVRGLNGESGS